MKTAILRAPERVPECTVVRQRQLQRQIKRFNKRYRKAIELLACKHMALADLAFSFPALLFALVCPHKGLNRFEVLDAIRVGAPLNTLAALAGIPFWLRKLQPEAFSTPIQKLPDDPAFVAQIGNCLPKRKKSMRRWLQFAYKLSDLGHGPFVAWALRVLIKEKSCDLRTEQLHAIVLWSWYSLHGNGLAASCIETPWTPKITRKQAYKAAKHWHENLRLKLAQRAEQIEDAWFEPGCVDGFEFVPLMDVAQILLEAKKMKNCMADYIDSVVLNRCRLWKVVRDGKTKAVLEIADRCGLQALSVVQLHGPENDDVSPEIAKAARQWQAQQSVDCISPRVSRQACLPSQEIWRRLWKPYWFHQRRVPRWLPAKPDWYVFDELSYSLDLGES